MGTLYNIFKQQIDQAKIIDEQALANIVYKQVWSGETISIGDKPLFAYIVKDVKGDIYDPNNLLLVLFLERELTLMDNKFTFIAYVDDNPVIPILSKK